MFNIICILSNYVANNQKSTSYVTWWICNTSKNCQLCWCTLDKWSLVFKKKTILMNWKTQDFYSTTLWQIQNNNTTEDV